MPAIPSPPTLTAPQMPPPYTAQPFGYTPPSIGTFAKPKTGPTTPYGAFAGTVPSATPLSGFTGQAPTAPQTGHFVAPDPGSFQTDPSYQWRLSQGLKGVEHGAAARGTLLTGGTQKALTDYGQQAASQEYGNAYQRALATYGANRDTDAQNFGHAQTGYQDALAGYSTNRDTDAQNFSHGQTGYQDALAGYATNRDTHAQAVAQDHQTFEDALAGYQANTSAALAAGAHGLSAATAGYDRTAAAGRQSFEDAQSEALRQHGVATANNQNAYQTQLLEYGRQQDEARRQQDQQIQQRGQSEWDSRRQAEIDRQRNAQIEEDAQRQREAFDRRTREETDRQNTARGAVLPPAVPLSLLNKGRRTGASFGA